MQKKEKLQKLANDIQQWFGKTPNFIAYNAIGAAVHVNNGQLPEIKFQPIKDPKMVIDVNGLENVKKWQDVPKEIVIKYNPYRLKQVGIADPEQYLQESLERAFEQEYPVFSENHRVSLATKPQNNDLLSFYVQTGEKSKQPIYFKHTFNTVEQLNTYLQSRKIKFYQQTPGQPLIVDDTMLKQQYLSSQKGPIGKGISLPRPLNASSPFRDKVAMNNPGDLLQQMLIDKTYDPNTIQGVIQRVGKGNFFSDKNQSLDGINVEYNWSTDDKKQYKSLTTFSDINYDEHQGCFPIIREMLQVVLTEKQFKKVKYSKIKKQIILPKDAFAKDDGTNYNPIQGFHNVDILYKDYIYKVLDDISNQHGLFSHNLSQKELIFFAIERIKADYQAARFYFKESCNIDDELIKYSQLKGHYIDDDSSTGMKFQNHTYINLKPLFNQGGKPIKSVHVKNGNGWLEVNLKSDYDLSQQQLDKLTEETKKMYVEGCEPLNKHTYKEDYEITNHQLDIYRNAAMLAALDGRYFPSQDKNQDEYYLTHAHWFTLFKINNKKLLDYVEKEPYAAQHSFNNDDYNPYQIEQITINNNEQQTCRKLTPNKKTIIADDDEIIKRLLNLGFAGIPLNANVKFDEYCSPELKKFYSQMINPSLNWKINAQTSYPLRPQVIMYLLIQTALQENFDLKQTIRHFARNFDTYKQGNQLPAAANDVIGNKICDTINNVVRAKMQVINQQQVVGTNPNTNGNEGQGYDATNVETEVPITTNQPAVPAAPEIVLLVNEENESKDKYLEIDDNGNPQVITAARAGQNYKAILPPNYLYLFFQKLRQIDDNNRPTILRMIGNILNSNLPLNNFTKVDDNGDRELMKCIFENIKDDINTNNIDTNRLTYATFFGGLKTFLEKEDANLTKINNYTEEELKKINTFFVDPNENLWLQLDTEDQQQIITSSFEQTLPPSAKIKLVYHDQDNNKCLISINGVYFNVNAVKRLDDNKTVIKLLVFNDHREQQEIDITNAQPFQEVAQLDIEGGKIKINPVQTQVQNATNIQVNQVNQGNNINTGLNTGLSINNIANAAGSINNKFGDTTNIQNNYVLLVFDDQNEQVVSIDCNGNIEEVDKKVGNEPGNISLDSIRFTVLPPNYLYLFFQKLSQINVGDSQQNAKKLVTMIDNILNSNLPLYIRARNPVPEGAEVPDNNKLINTILQGINKSDDINNNDLKYDAFFRSLKNFLLTSDCSNVDFGITDILKKVDNYFIAKDQDLYLQLDAENPLLIISSFHYRFQQNATIRFLHKINDNKCLISIDGTYFIANTVKTGNKTVIKLLVFNDHCEQQEINITNAQPNQEVAQLNIEGGKIEVQKINRVQSIINNAKDLNKLNCRTKPETVITNNIGTGLNNTTINLGNTGGTGLNTGAGGNTKKFDVDNLNNTGGNFSNGTLNITNANTNNQQPPNAVIVDLKGLTFTKNDDNTFALSKAGQVQITSSSICIKAYPEIKKIYLTDSTMQQKLEIDTGNIVWPNGQDTTTVQININNNPLSTVSMFYIHGFNSDSYYTGEIQYNILDQLAESCKKQQPINNNDINKRNDGSNLNKANKIENNNIQ